MRMMGMALQVVRSDGVLALYNGLSASLCRQVPPAVPVPEPTCRAAHAGRGESWLRRGCASCPPWVPMPIEATLSLLRLFRRKEPQGWELGRRGGRRAGRCGVCCSHPHSRRPRPGLSHLLAVWPWEGFSSLWSG